jgi:Zn-dependent protease
MNGFRLGSVLGFEIRIDYSWFVIAFLILWSFSAGVFPARYPGLEPAVYLMMGTIGAVLFFASLLAHEISHSVVARRRGIRVEGITLFVFGGMAHTRSEAETPEDELVIAGVGPLASVVIGILFGSIGWIGARAGWPDSVTGVATYLAFLNLLLAGFNLLPGFPLDGGRLFRAAVWKATGDLTRATRWATNGGKGLAYTLVGYGLLLIVGGSLGAGLWLVFIGWFLRTAATASYQQHLLRDLMVDVSAGDIMTPHPLTVPPDLPLRDLVELRFLREPHQGYPVVDGGHVVGMVTLDHVRKAARHHWDELLVADVMAPAETLTVEPSASLTEVLEAMTGSRTNRVVVSEFGRLLGVISASDVTRRVLKAQVLAELEAHRN